MFSRLPLPHLTFAVRRLSKRMIALAAQQFVSDIAASAKLHTENRVQSKKGGGTGSKVRTTPAQFSSSLIRATGSNRCQFPLVSDFLSIYCCVQAKLVLTTQDLSAALKEHGVVVRKPEFFR